MMRHVKEMLLKLQRPQIMSRSENDTDKSETLRNAVRAYLLLPGNTNFVCHSSNISEQNIKYKAIWKAEILKADKVTAFNK